MKKSYNIPTILVAQQVGPEKVFQMAKNLGITTLIEDGHYTDINLSMALGGLSKGTTPLEMAAAYGTIGNSGKYNAPTAIIKIVDRNGKVIFEHKQETKTVVDAKAAYQTVDIMRDVFVDGTAGGAGIGRPAAGKTGTTDDYKDAWFVGFTPNLSAAVWIGDDNGRPLDYMYGSGAPLSIWHEFMVNALANVPVANFVRPAGVVIPPEPDIKNDDKDKDKDKYKDKDKDKDKKGATSVPGEPPKPPSKKDRIRENVGDVEPQKPSMKKRVQEILDGSENNTGNQKPVVSNVPTPRQP